MATKNTFWKAVTLVVILGPIALTFLGFVSGLLSPREWAIGIVFSFAAMLLLAVVRQRMARRAHLLGAPPGAALDVGARRRILRRIRMNKAWIGVLAVCLPVGIVDGVEHRAWFPTAAGVGVNLLLMYVAIEKIRRLRTLKADLPSE